MENNNDTPKRIWLTGESLNEGKMTEGFFGSRGANNKPAGGRTRATSKNKKTSSHSKRNMAAAATVSVLLLVGAVMMTILLSGDNSIAAMSFGASGNAKFTVNVVEGYTDTPITGAKVVILETGKTYTTDENGNSGVIDVPVVRDTRFDGIIPKPWGEVSLIVYKDGFLPYALFYLQVIGGETRNGVKILLFENNSTGNSEPFSIIEGPNRLWVDELVKRYQPQD